MTKRFSFFAPIILLIVLLLWFVAGAVAETTPTESLNIVQVQWKVIVALLGLVQVLIGFIYISGITSVKNSISKLFDQIDELNKEKLDIEIHKELCRRREKR